jgi:iron complex transport system substrate-binding protein
MNRHDRFSFLLLSMILAACCLFIGAAGASPQEREESPPENPAQRIITMSPAITEMVFALGAGDRVVATSDFRSFPEEALSREKVGGAVNPNFEKITALRPTLIIIQGVNAQIADFCRLRGIPFFRVKLDNMADIAVALRQIGGRIGRAKEAEALVQEIASKIGTVRDAVGTRPRPKVFLSLHHVPGSLARLTTAGPGSFLQDAVEAAGGDNIFSDLNMLYPAVSKESLLKRQPDIIVEMLYDPSMSEEGRRILLEDWQALPGIPAVRRKRIVLLDDDFSLIPGPRCHRLVEKLARIFHPEARFPDE